MFRASCWPSALSAYVNRYAVAPGERLLLCTTNDNGYRTALDWRRIGREVTAVVDSRPQPDGELAQQARAAGIEVIAGHGVIAALGGQAGARRPRRAAPHRRRRPVGQKIGQGGARAKRRRALAGRRRRIGRPRRAVWTAT